MIWSPEMLASAPYLAATGLDRPAPGGAFAHIRQALSLDALDLAAPKGLSGDVGVVIRRRPQHVGVDHPMLELYPILELKAGKRWRISLDDGVKWTAAQRGPWSVGPVLEYREAFRDHLPATAHRMPSAFELGGFSLWKTGWGDVEARLRRALNSYQGWSADLSYDAGVRLTPISAIGFEARGGWADANFSDAYFGVRRDHPLDLPNVRKNDYFTLGGEVTLGVKISKNTTLFGQASQDRIYGAAWGRPFLMSRNIFVFSIGIAHHFGARDPDSLL